MRRRNSGQESAEYATPHANNARKTVFVSTWTILGGRADLVGSGEPGSRDHHGVAIEPMAGAVDNSCPSGRTRVRLSGVAQSEPAHLTVAEKGGRKQGAGTSGG